MRTDYTGGETAHAALNAPKLRCRTGQAAETALDTPKMVWTRTRQTRAGKTANAALETADIDAPTAGVGIIRIAACAGGGFGAHAAPTLFAGGGLFLLLFHGRFHGFLGIAAAATPANRPAPGLRIIA